jgi:hypothetical protein
MVKGVSGASATKVAKSVQGWASLSGIPGITGQDVHRHISNLANFGSNVKDGLKLQNMR